MTDQKPCSRGAYDANRANHVDTCELDTDVLDLAGLIAPLPAAVRRPPRPYE